VNERNQAFSSRREFLRGCVASVAVAAVPRIALAARGPLPDAALRRRMEDDWDALAL
jgi:hypothetical protein